MKETDFVNMEKKPTAKKKRRKQLSVLTKKALLLMLDKNNYLVTFAGTYRIRTKDHSPLLRIHKKTFTAIFPYIRKSGQFWVIALHSVRALKKNTWLKKQYLKQYNENKREKFIDSQLNTNDNGNNIQGG